MIYHKILVANGTQHFVLVRPWNWAPNYKQIKMKKETIDQSNFSQQ